MLRRRGSHWVSRNTYVSKKSTSLDKIIARHDEACAGGNVRRMLYIGVSAVFMVTTGVLPPPPLHPITHRYRPAMLIRVPIPSLLPSRSSQSPRVTGVLHGTVSTLTVESWTCITLSICIFDPPRGEFSSSRSPKLFGSGEARVSEESFTAKEYPRLNLTD